MIGSVQPNSDGDGTDESSDEEEIPLALAVVPSPTKAKKVRYYPRVSTLPRIPPPTRVNAPAIPRKKSVSNPKFPPKVQKLKPIGKIKVKTPVSATKSMRTHYNMKIMSLNKKIAKAQTTENTAVERLQTHRDILSQSRDKACKEFIEKNLSKFIMNNKTQLKNAFYEDEEGETVSYAHNLAGLLRALADIVDSKNAEVSALEEELEGQQQEFAQWTLKNTLETTGLSKEQVKQMLSNL